MTWLEMVAHYKGYRNWLQDSGEVPLTPLIGQSRRPERRPNGRGQRSLERPFASAVLPVRRTTGARS